MKTKVLRKRHEEGGILIVALLTGFLLGLGLCSYLVLVNAQDRSVARSQRWNSSLNMAEAGIEEALAQVNSITNFTDAVDTSYLSGNGWSLSGGKFGPVTRYLVGGYYSAVFVTNPTPTIYCTGYVATPFQTAYVQRHVKLTTMQLPLINVPLGAQDGIDMNGQGPVTDSFNSYDTNQSANGLYSGFQGTNGSVASVDGLVDLGNHTIFGNLYLGPGATYGSGTNQVTGQIFYDYNILFPDASLPSGVSWFSAATTVNSNGVYDFTAFNTTINKYYDVNDNKGIVVEPGVTVTLRVNSTGATGFKYDPTVISILGGATNSGKLTIYQVAGSFNLNGGGFTSTNCAPGYRAEDFYFYGLPGVTSITLSGDSTIRAVIYAPEAFMTMNGGGNNANLVGSAIVEGVKLNGHYDFHFDTALLTNGPIRGYIAGSWQEF